MNRLVIGIPARNEGENIAQLADRLELGSVSLGEATRCELVLAYQSSDDDTLERWHARRFRRPHRVLRCPEGVTGKGRNVKLLISHALDTDADLLLVDADLRSYPPANVARFVHAEPPGRGGLTLPLWCRPRGEGNSTNFLACPLLLASFGARVRQPLAGQMLLSRKLLARIDLERLPDDYGVDIALTMAALDHGLPVAQVAVPFPDHVGGGNSHRIMADVAATALRRLAEGPVTARPDVRWPDRYWEGQTWLPPSSRSLEPLLLDLVSPDGLARASALLDEAPEVVADLWCRQLAAAVTGARRGEQVPELVEDLAVPFLVHAEYRRRVDIDLEGAEAYVESLGHQLARLLS
ncbi:MAG: hypothetical protein J2P59_01735 [Acidimicrobiales bacterium]|nr:hypothetical protein [Acidimicrobiales bacterium]